MPTHSPEYALSFVLPTFRIFRTSTSSSSPHGRGVCYLFLDDNGSRTCSRDALPHRMTLQLARVVLEWHYEYVDGYPAVLEVFHDAHARGVLEVRAENVRLLGERPRGLCVAQMLKAPLDYYARGEVDIHGRPLEKTGS
jgi:hypothetical protein